MQKLVVVILVSMGSFVYPSYQKNKLVGVSSHKENVFVGSLLIVASGFGAWHTGGEYIRICRECNETQQEVSLAEQHLLDAKKDAETGGNFGHQKRIAALPFALPDDLSEPVKQFSVGSTRLVTNVKMAEAHLANSRWYAQRAQERKSDYLFAYRLVGIAGVAVGGLACMFSRSSEDIFSE